MMNSGGWYNDKTEWQRNIGIALNANPVVKEYMKKRCPECAEIIDEISASAPTPANEAEIRSAEVNVLASVEDFVIYTTPWIIAEKCEFIYGWDKQRLLDLADLTDKTVLDVGAGTGRLAFAAAEKAAWVYASEPVGTLREFMRDKAANEGIKNVRILDGFVTDLPFPDNTFDIVMSGHVVGDDYESEVAELTRVCKPDGWLIDCPGDEKGDAKLDKRAIENGWEAIHYVGSFDKDVYCYRKQVKK